MLSIRHSCLDDTVNEGPHSQANKIQAHNFGASSWSWIASSMRLNHNLDEADELPTKIGTDIDTAWLHYKDVLPQRKVCRAEVGRAVYQMAQWVDRVGDISSEDEDEDDLPDILGSENDDDNNQKANSEYT